MPEGETPGRVVVHREAKRELRRLPTHILRSVLEGIRALADDPHPAGCSKLRGHESLYRIRIGDWRVVYEADSATRIVTVLRVASRGEVYRGL